MWLPALTVLLLVTLSSGTGSKNLYPNKQRSNEYDYIIVGAGSAGAVLANRLSEDQDVHVLLLEAGGLPSGMSEVPFFFGAALGTEIDWKYFSEPQKNAALANKEQRTYVPRGKGLGGSSLLNGMIYLRGASRDFDEWSKGGATGWSWKEVLPYFKKSEDLRNHPGADMEYHGTGGYLTVSGTNYGTEIREAYLEGAKSIGYDQVDINGKSNVGFSPAMLTTRDGRRCSTEKAFLRPAASRENLDILIHAHVTKVLFDENKRAHSVRFEHNKVTQEVRATREIIMSAGAIGTPQILMLSGIGPREHLEELQIPVVADLPVGQNLYDHMTSYGQIYALNSSVTEDPSKVLTPENVGLFQLGQGPMTVPVGFSVFGNVNTKFQEDKEWPDIQMCLPYTGFLPSFTEEMRQFNKKHEGKNLLGVYPTLVRPKSTGVVKLRSTDPYEDPSIDLRYFSDPEDLARLAQGKKIAHSIMQSPALQKYDTTLLPMKGCAKFETGSEDYFACLAQRYSMTCYQLSGTCRMGDPSDPSTVLDPQLRVKGVKGLRVVDASVMPMTTSGTSNPVVIMIGEKAADMIKSARN